MKTTPRLHLEAPLSAGPEVALPREQAHYLTGVLRLGSGDPVSVFNATDGEWLAYLATVTKKAAHIRCERHVSEVKPPPDIDYLFAPLKHARLDYMVQKATELGARRLRPVITQRTIAERVNLERMKANVDRGGRAMQSRLRAGSTGAGDAGRSSCRSGSRGGRLIYCDETAAIANPVEALKDSQAPAAVLVGPEGGFTGDEKAHAQMPAPSSPPFRSAPASCGPIPWPLRH